MNQDFKERRKHARLSLSLPMQLQWTTEEGTILHRKSNSVNVSTGGVYYKSREGFPLETDAIITFKLPTNDAVDLRILRARGQIIRIEDIDTAEKGIAVKFVEDLKFSTIYNN